MTFRSTGQQSSDAPEDAQIYRRRGEEDDTDTDVTAAMGGEDIDDYGTTLGEAASGVLKGVDIEEARQRLHDAQIALVCLGYRIGYSDELTPEFDGVWGPDTRDAVAAFQVDRELPATGQLDGDTYDLLLREYADALSTEGRRPLQDDFDPIQAGQPLGRGDVDLLEPTPPEATNSTFVDLEELDDAYRAGELPEDEEAAIDATLKEDEEEKETRQ